MIEYGELAKMIMQAINETMDAYETSLCDMTGSILIYQKKDNLLFSAGNVDGIGNWWVTVSLDGDLIINIDTKISYTCQNPDFIAGAIMTRIREYR